MTMWAVAVRFHPAPIGGFSDPVVHPFLHRSQTWSATVSRLESVHISHVLTSCLTLLCRFGLQIQYHQFGTLSTPPRLDFAELV